MSEEKPFFYCNGLQVATSPYDITLNFIRHAPKVGAATGLMAGVPSDPVRAAELLVSMSPMHAKAMLPGLFKVVADYENTFGPIALPKEIQDLYSKTFLVRSEKSDSI